MKSYKLILITALFFTIFCSCEDEDTVHFSYDIINGDLVLKTIDGEKYLKFNDEADYSIFLDDVFFTSILLKDEEFNSHFNNKNETIEAINSFNFSDFNKDDIEDADLAEIVAKTYYNLRDYESYSGESRYGYQEYYIEHETKNLVYPQITHRYRFFRSKDDSDIPDGAVIIRTLTYPCGYSEAMSMTSNPFISDELHKITE